MSEIIEFYVPQRFQKHLKWVPELERGKVIEFPLSKASVAPDFATVRGHQHLEHGNAALENCAVVCLSDAAEVHRLFEILENR
jgi:hypothetical protein